MNAFNKRLRFLTASIVMMLAWVFNPTASASLIGDQITVASPPDAGVTCTVGTDCNGSGAVGFDDLTVGAYSISVDVQQWLYGYTVDFTDLDFSGIGEVLTNVIIDDAGCCYLYGDPSVFDITDHSFSLTYFHTVPDQGEIISMSLYTNHNVPEPGTLALMGLGLAGVGFRFRRHNVKT